MGFFIVVIIFVVGIICCAIYDNQPEVKQGYENQFMKSIGVDPNSEHGQMLKTMASTAQMNEELKKKEQREEAAKIVKGAVVGGIVGGDAGAVVGAVVAKNQIDNSKK